MGSYLKGERRVVVVVREEGMGWEEEQPPDLMPPEVVIYHDGPEWKPNAHWEWQKLQLSKPANGNPP